MPEYCGWLCAAWKIEVFAFAICSRSSLSAKGLPDPGSILYGGVSSSNCWSSVVITVVAMPLATSPAL